jgi:hypothetical protein
MPSLGISETGDVEHVRNIGLTLFLICSSQQDVRIRAKNAGDVQVLFSQEEIHLDLNIHL